MSMWPFDGGSGIQVIALFLKHRGRRLTSSRHLRSVNMTDRDDSYEVGYSKPPRHARFTKGQSGNPKGRPKGSQNLATILARVGRERVKVTGKSGNRSITKLEASV